MIKSTQTYLRISSQIWLQSLNPPRRFRMEGVKEYYKKLNLGGEKFKLHRTNHDNALKLLEGINPSKAAGPDNLAGKFLKDGTSILATPITELCNLSISLARFPDDCKQVKLKPLFKKGSKMNQRIIDQAHFCHRFLK